MEKLREKLIIWKTNMKVKGLRVNMGKTNVLVYGPGLDMLQKSGKDPHGVCLKGNSFFCSGCSRWIHNNCSGSPGPLKPDLSHRCEPCTGQARPIDGKPMTQVTVGREKLEVVPSFCYLGDRLSSRGQLRTLYFHKMPEHMGKSQWAPAHPHLLLISLTSRGTCRVYNSCVWSAMLHASETWALTSSDLHRLLRNDRAVIRCICSITIKDEVSSQDLLERMRPDDLA